MKIIKSFEELFSELGIKKGDQVNILCSPIEREYEIDIELEPDEEELKHIIKNVPRETLRKMGVGVWSVFNDGEDDNEDYLNSGDVHYLFPGEWYEHIPNGFDVVDINGKQEKFEKGVSDDDVRFGCLPYGFVRNETPIGRPLK